MLLWRFPSCLKNNKKPKPWILNGVGEKKQQVLMDCKYISGFSFNRVQLSVLPCYHESSVNVCVYQGNTLLSSVILLRLIIFIQRIYNRSSLAALRAGRSCGEKHSQKTSRHVGRYASSFIIPGYEFRCFLHWRHRFSIVAIIEIFSNLYIYMWHCLRYIG